MEKEKPKVCPECGSSNIKLSIYQYQHEGQKKSRKVWDCISCLSKEHKKIYGE